MALDDDNNTQVNDATQAPDTSLDADIPVDPDAEADNSAVARGTDKKKVVGLGIVVGLVVLAAILVFSLSKKPNSTSPTTEPPLTAQLPPEDAPPPAETPGEAPAPAETPQKSPTVNPNQVVNDSGTLARPTDQDWVKGINKPLPVPNGLEGTPGIPGSNAPQIKVVQGPVGGSSAPAGSKEAAMQQLWQQGARAKHNGDFAAARKAWQRILELDPQHAGIQEALDKLPG